MKSLEDIFTAEELASIDAGTYDIKKLAAKLDYCIALEREACAKVCDKIERHKWEILTQGGKLEGLSPRDCAVAIRARGQK